MSNFWHREKTTYAELLTLTSTLWILPTVRMETCNPGIKIRPVVDIASSPDNNGLSIGASTTLNCAAQPRETDSIYLDRWVDYIEWYDPQGRQVGAVCRQPSNVHHHKLQLSCPLVLKNLTADKFGFYTCQAGNGYVKHCTRKSVRVGMKDAEVTLTEVPQHQSADLGANVTFNCTAKGLHFKPKISWIKSRDSIPLQSNSSFKVMDEKSIRSQLLIVGVDNESFGEYRCEAESFNGKYKVVSSWALLTQKGSGIQTPKITEDPRQQRVSIGSDATFSCAAKGIPRPTIYWNKGNVTQTQEKNPRVRVIPDDRRLRSQLLITGVEMEDYGIYRCIANSSGGSSPSGVAVLNIVKEPQENSTSQMTTTVLLWALVAALLCVIIWIVWNWLKKRSKQRRKNVAKAYLEKDKDLEYNVSLLENHEVRVGERESPNEQRSLDSIQDIEEARGQAKSERGEKITNCDIVVSDRGVDLGVDEQQDLREISQETEEGCSNLENLEVLNEILGEGEFGIVYKGRYGKKDGNMIDVAVKKLKDPCAIAKDSLLNEIRTLKQAGKHPNIVTLIGTRIEGGNLLVITEFIHGGSLEKLLKVKNESRESKNYRNFCCKLNDRQLVTIAFQIAAGMQHLEEKKFVHRDLAARNILVDANLVAKVGDFGLARDISDAGIYTVTSNGKVPWRWSSLESLRDLNFTSMSDVWSFGIVLWEIATYGELPYRDMTSPFVLINRLTNGYRMPRPDQCSEELYELMSSCWKENPMMRPTFSDIARQLNHFLREVKRTYVNIQEDSDVGDV